MSARPPFEPERDRAHARLLLSPILEREGCDMALLEPVLDMLVNERRLDGPTCVHWLLGSDGQDASGQNPLAAWRAGRLNGVLGIF